MSHPIYSRIRRFTPDLLAIRVTVFLSVAPLLLAMASGQENEVQIRATLDRVHRDRRSSAITSEVVDGTIPELDAVRLIQSVLDLDTDSFSEKLTSNRATIESRLSTASAGFLRKYEGIANVDAAEALTQASDDLSIQKLRNVARRYFVTPSGYLACEKLVVLWMDAGEYELASRLAARVLAEPAHSARISKQFRSTAAKLQSIIRVHNVVQHPTAPISADGQPSKLDLQFTRFRSSLFPLDQGWMLLGGSGSRDGAISGSAPVPVATWQADFFRNQASWEVREFLTEWEGNRRELDQSLCPAVYPIVIDGSVIFRDAVGIRSVDAVHGTANWSFTTNFKPLMPISRLEKQRRRFTGEAQNLLGDNSLMGAISSNGQLVFTVDSLSSHGSEPGEESDEDDDVRLPHWKRNRLVALYAKPLSGQGAVAWVNTGKASAVRHGSPDPTDEALDSPEGNETPAGAAEPRFAGSTVTAFSFLGAPLPGLTELMSLTEHDDGIHLTGLDPRTGHVMWSQPLCTIERNDPANAERRMVACLPARAEGIVVCPTNSGLLVAVDQARLNLLWATYVGELPDAKAAQNRGRQHTQPVSAPATFGSPVIISQGRVVYLPPRSFHLYCLDLATGKTLWSVDRDGAEFVGAVSEGKVVVVGRSGCRALAIEDGHELWQVPTGAPAGRGIALGNRYVQPLDDGSLVALDLVTGQNHGTRVLRSKVALGHLAADHHRVYSVSQRGVVAFPQVDSAVSDALGGNSQITRAEVTVVRGELKDAERQFREILATDLSSADRLRSRDSLKELLFERIAVGTDIVQADAELLDQLLETPADQFRFLIATSALQGQVLSDRMIAQLVEGAYQLDPTVTGIAGPGADWTISPAAWTRLQLRAVDASPFARQIQRFGHEHRPRLQPGESTDEIQRYIRAFDRVPELAPARAYLASRFVSERSMHAAETLLLCNKDDDSTTIAADATRQLAELWERCGFAQDAARQLQLLATTYAETRLPGGMTGRQYVHQLSADRPAKQAWLQNQEPAWTVNHVEIVQTSVIPGFVQQGALKGKVVEALESDRAELVAPGRYFRTAVAEFVTSPSNIDDRMDVSIHDYRTRLRLGGLTVPLAYRLAGSDKFGSAGHLVPFGVAGGVLGVSTLQLGDEAPVWQQFPNDLAGRRTPVFPGPSGAEFASFTWRNRLYVIDPVDGSLLWHRQIPLPSQDSNQNVRLEVVGDRRALGVMSLDRTRYDVFETATGRPLSTVVTGFVANHWQGAYGRHVMGYVAIQNGWRLQIRDLLKETPDIDELVVERSRPPILVHGELVYLGPGGEVKIYDITRGKQKLSGQFDAAEILTNGAARVISDSSRYFVNLQRPAAVLPRGHQAHQWLNSQVPGSPARDDLYAIDRTSGEIVWKRTIPYRTILQFPDCDVPFLVTVSQSKEVAATNAKQSLTIEVIDSQTGTTIGYRENLTFDQILSTHYDGEAGRILLRCLASDIELQFGPSSNQAGSPVSPRQVAR